jgi:hypothetical protein
MKGTTTFFLVPLVIGLGAAVFGLSSLGYEKFSVWQWCLAVMAVLLAGLILGALLNFSVFAPVYWLLGRLHSKRPETQTGHEHETSRLSQ